MLGKLDCIAIWSEDPERLYQWYKKVFGVEETLRENAPEDTGVGIDVGGLLLWFGKHSEIHGDNKDPLRHIFEFKVDNLDEVYGWLKKAGAKIIREPSYSPTVNADVLTAEDPERNTIQFFQVRG